MCENCEKFAPTGITLDPEQESVTQQAVSFIGQATINKAKAAAAFAGLLQEKFGPAEAFAAAVRDTDDENLRLLGAAASLIGGFLKQDEQVFKAADAIVEQFVQAHQAVNSGTREAFDSIVGAEFGDDEPPFPGNYL